MKKLLTLLMLLCTVCTGAWAEIQSSTLLNPVPYLIRNLNCGYIANDLSRYHANSTDTSDGYGQFIFIETGTANQYKIYELSTKRYFSAKANFNTSAKAQTELVENEQSATTWIITQKNSAPDKYTISPSTNTGAFLNFHGGTSANENVNGAVGFHTNGNNDEGSFWLFEKCQYLPESPIKGKVYTIINDHKGVPYYVANTQTTNSIQDITTERSTNGSQEWICWNASSGGFEFVNVLDGQKLKSANNYVAFDIDDLRALVGFAVLGHGTMVHIAGNKNNNTLNGGIFTKKEGVNAVFNEYDERWSTDFIFSPTGQQAYKLIVSGKDDATVTYSDQTRLNGGYFVFADEYTPQEGDFDFHAPTGYIAIFSVDTENNTITVNYTEDVPTITEAEMSPVSFGDKTVYRFKSQSGKYLSTKESDVVNHIVSVEESATDETIFFFDALPGDGGLHEIIGYCNGAYLLGDKNCQYQDSYTAISNKQNQIAIKEYDGKYYLKYGTKWITYNESNAVVLSNEIPDGWIREEVTEIPLTMYKPKADEERYYSSLFFPIEVRLPEGVAAYAADRIEDNYVYLNRWDKNGILAHSTAAIIYSEGSESLTHVAGNRYKVYLSISDTGEEYLHDLLWGSTYATTADHACMWEGDDDDPNKYFAYSFNYDSSGTVGFYKNTGKVGAFKAFFPSFYSSFMGTSMFLIDLNSDEQPTSINAINIETSGEGKIFSIDGRASHKAVKGINITNGKKLIIK